MSAIATMWIACGGSGAASHPQLDAGLPDDASIAIDAAIPIDAHVLPGSVVEVSSAGDDANDGVTRPVRTLKQAIAIAAAHREITSISIAAGIYAPSSGEVFPYTIPASVTVVGPADGPRDGFAILVGTGTETAIFLEDGKLENLTFEDFSVAIVARGPGALEKVRIRTGALAVRAETTARLTVSGLDIAGVDGACALGIDLIGEAVLTATDLIARRLGTSLQLGDQASASVTRASVTGDSACAASTLAVRSSGTFALVDSILFGGRTGLVLTGAGAGSPLRASLSNVIVRDMSGGGLGGRHAIVQITSSEISHNEVGGLAISSGTWSLTDVALTDNAASGAFLLGLQDEAPVVLTMRGCTVTGNRQGLSVSDFAVLDLGTPDSPGNNVLGRNIGVALHVSAEEGQREIDAVGNTWQPFVQGADKDGRYAATTIRGPIEFSNGNNFAIVNATRSLKL